MQPQTNKFDDFKKYCFIMCSFIPVGLEDYVDFFSLNFSRFIYLNMTFPHKKGRIKVRLEAYTNGELVKSQEIHLLPSVKNKTLYFLLLPINYFLYLIVSIYMINRSLLNRNRGDIKTLFFGINYFCTLIGLAMRLIKRVDYVVYRVMDFFPIPPSGMYRYLNRLFFMIDRICLNKSNFIIFTTEGHIAGREKYGYFNRTEYRYHVVPLGVLDSKIVMEPVDKLNKNTIVYCGVVSKYHMLDLLFDVLVRLKEKIPNIKLEIIGSGPDVDYFQQLAKAECLEKNVTFYGFLPEGEKFQSIMSKSVLGIALYRDEEDFMRYTEPAKVKHYLSFGTPVLISDVPMIAKELSRKKVALTVHNDKNEISAKILKFLDNKDMQALFKNNIKSYLKEVDIDSLLHEVLSVAFKMLTK